MTRTTDSHCFSSPRRAHEQNAKVMAVCRGHLGAIHDFLLTDDEIITAAADASVRRWHIRVR